jgi:hypothetical protein
MNSRRQWSKVDYVIIDDDKWPEIKYVNIFHFLKENLKNLIALGQEWCSNLNHTCMIDERQLWRPPTIVNGQIEERHQHQKSNNWWCVELKVLQRRINCQVK